jgi:hypothetical protein
MSHGSAGSGESRRSRERFVVVSVTTVVVSVEDGPPTTIAVFATRVPNVAEEEIRAVSVSVREEFAGIVRLDQVTVCPFNDAVSLAEMYVRRFESISVIVTFDAWMEEVFVTVML